MTELEQNPLGSRWFFSLPLSPPTPSFSSSSPSFDSFITFQFFSFIEKISFFAHSIYSPPSVPPSSFYFSHLDLPHFCLNRK